MCVHTPQLNRWTDRRENWPKNSESNTGVIRGFTDCHIVDLATESPRVEFSPENSRYSRRISRGDRKKFANKISLSQKAAGNFAFNYFERTNLRSGSPHIYCTVRDKIRKSLPDAALCDKKDSYVAIAPVTLDARVATKIDRSLASCQGSTDISLFVGNLFVSRCTCWRDLDRGKEAMALIISRRIDAKVHPATFASRCTRCNPPPFPPSRGWWAAGWGCGGRFSNNYIGLRWWWVAMATAVPSASYDWRQPSDRAVQPGSLLLRTLESGCARARGPVGNGFPRTSAVRLHCRWWNWINNYGLVIRECIFRVAFFADAP